MRIIDGLVHRIKPWLESISPIVDVQIKSDISCSHKITICIFPHHTKKNAINNNK